MPHLLAPPRRLFEQRFQPRHIVGDQRQTERQHPQAEDRQDREKRAGDQQEAGDQPEPEARRRA
jgi:UPF0716 family protein affecting phage T7 exclusion